MIPKIIHYVWLGNKNKPNFVNSCILSWKEKMPEYEIIEWNENNVDIDKLRKENRFFDECYKRNMYAYMSDYIRLLKLYEYGGIYFDTDVQVIKSLDKLIVNKKLVVAKESNNMYGSAVICVEKKNPVIKEMIKFYDKKIWEEPLFTTPHIVTYSINNFDNKKDITILDSKYFYPYYFDDYFTDKCITKNTYTIHWWSQSWTEKKFNIFLNTKHIKNPIKRKLIYFKKMCGYYYRKIRGMIE